MLTKVVLADIQYHAQLAAKDEEAFVRQLHSMSMKEQTAEINRFKKKIKEIKWKLEKTDDLLRVAFEKLASGVLSDAIFNNITQGYQTEKSNARS